MATRNGVPFITEQLASIERQTRLPDQLVICDDRSTDSTLEVAHAFASQAPFPVEVHRNTHSLGFADNFITAAGLCTGDLIAFCDQDDVWSEVKLERCASLFGPKTKLVVHAAELVDEQLHALGGDYPRIKRTQRRPPGRHDPWFFTPGLSQVFSAELLSFAKWAERPSSQDLDGHQMDHDEWITFHAAACGETVFLAERLARYRQHEAQTTFGTRSRGGLIERVRTSLRNDEGTYEARGKLLQEYSNYWRSRTEREEVDDVRARAADMADAYRRAAALQFGRARLYTDALSRRQRFRQLATLLGRRSYGSRTDGGLGRRALAKDMGVALFGSSRA